MSKRFGWPLVAVCGVLLALPAAAQGEWSWPERGQNLKELPADFTGARLRAVMTGFTNALGVRCSHCHVGEEGAPLGTYDFVSDANPNKNTARKMLQLLGVVNDKLKEVEPSGDRRVNMWCHTCHRGRPRPLTLGEELDEAHRGGGVDAALAKYRDLRNRHYGKGAYDFGEDGLNQLGYRLLGEADTAGAIKVFRLNAEQFPDSGNVWDSLAEAYQAAGETERAIVFYQKALALDPDNANAAEKLRALRGANPG